MLEIQGSLTFTLYAVTQMLFGARLDWIKQ